MSVRPLRAPGAIIFREPTGGGQNSDLLRVVVVLNCFQRFSDFKHGDKKSHLTSAHARDILRGFLSTTNLPARAECLPGSAGSNHAHDVRAPREELEAPSRNGVHGTTLPQELNASAGHVKVSSLWDHDDLVAVLEPLRANLFVNFRGQSICCAGGASSCSSSAGPSRAKGSELPSVASTKDMRTTLRTTLRTTAWAHVERVESLRQRTWIRTPNQFWDDANKLTCGAQERFERGWIAKPSRSLVLAARNFCGTTMTWLPFSNEVSVYVTRPAKAASQAMPTAQSAMTGQSCRLWRSA